MDVKLKQRLIGAIIILALIVIFVPMLFSKKHNETLPTAEQTMPQPPDQPNLEQKTTQADVSLKAKSDEVQPGESQGQAGTPSEPGLATPQATDQSSNQPTTAMPQTPDQSGAQQSTATTSATPPVAGQGGDQTTTATPQQTPDQSSNQPTTVMPQQAPDQSNIQTTTATPPASSNQVSNQTTTTTQPVTTQGGNQTTTAMPSTSGPVSNQTTAVPPAATNNVVPANNGNSTMTPSKIVSPFQNNQPNTTGATNPANMPATNGAATQENTAQQPANLEPANVNATDQQPGAQPSDVQSPEDMSQTGDEMAAPTDNQVEPSQNVPETPAQEPNDNKAGNLTTSDLSSQIDNIHVRNDNVSSDNVSKSAAKPTMIITPSHSHKSHKLAAVKTKSKSLANNYVVQLGVFSDASHAQKLIQELRSQGFTAFGQKTKTSTGILTHVYVGPSVSHEQATLTCNRLQKVMHIKGVVAKLNEKKVS